LDYPNNDNFITDMIQEIFYRTHEDAERFSMQFWNPPAIRISAQKAYHNAEIFRFASWQIYLQSLPEIF